MVVLVHELGNRRRGTHMEEKGCHVGYHTHFADEITKSHSLDYVVYEDMDLVYLLYY